MTFNPWHDVDMERTAPDKVRAIIEISKGSRAKYELDKKAGILKLDRVLYSSFYYPANYGFIPQTLGDDHDPLDILVISQINVEPLCIVRANVIGVMRMVAAMLYGAQPLDVLSLSAGLGVLIAAALVACLIPARRAARVDVVHVLRN